MTIVDETIELTFTNDGTTQTFDHGEVPAGELWYIQKWHFSDPSRSVADGSWDVKPGIVQDDANESIGSDSAHSRHVTQFNISDPFTWEPDAWATGGESLISEVNQGGDGTVHITISIRRVV